ncbi:MAG TPA: pectate lyase [Planctomycetaceae bacterium]|jgi:PelA/Pel-15E family pectate lyase|nr:pectate lyase [Planctomycetaceae bacterium]
MRIDSVFRTAAVLLIGTVQAFAAADDLPAQARAAMDRGVAFFHQQVAAHGGYVYLYSADLKKQEGEGKTTRETVWVQPPGTPSVGEAFVRAYVRTGDAACLAAAKDAAECLLQGQYRSGGWNASVEFDPAVRAKEAYRTDRPAPKKRQRNNSSLDDDKTQSALRFLMQLDRALKFKDERIHEATLFALDSLLAAQYPNGGWAQVWEAPADPQTPANLKARYPEDLPRKYPGGDYWNFYTFNDNNISNVIDVLQLAEEIYGGGRYRAAMLKAGEFILAAQMPDPQPAWAQQYNFQMEPVWARKFEPAAVSGGESQRLIETLMELYIDTGDRRFLEPIPKALAYLKKSQLPDGRLARFYELRTNRPLYLTTDYTLTYTDDDLPTHYGFQVPSRLPQLERRYETVSTMTPAKLAQEPKKSTALPKSASLEPRVRKIIAEQDDRGAWVEAGRLKYHGKGDSTDRVIASETFAKNLDLLSQFLQVSAAVR